MTAGFQAVNPGSGAPQRGGTLNMVGVSDVDYMDYDVGYYTTDYQVLRLTVRQLYSWPAIPGHNTTPAPDLATALPVVSDNGLKETVTLRSGVMWNTSPPRPVTVADVVRGIKRACNPSPVSFGGMADFIGAIQGLAAYCAGYPAKAASSASAMKQYIESHNVSGITTSGNTITFTLTRPAPWFTGAMTLPPFSAVPIEAENGLPGTPAVYNHMYSDGPYQQVSYTPKKSIKFTRNPQWQASTDPLRKAYVDAINVDETGNQTTIYQQMPTGSASLGMTFDSLPPPANYPNMLNQVKSGSHNVNLGATYSSNPYLVFNTVSPNNAKALGKVDVRQALSYGIERSQLQKVLGGPIINPPLTHVLPAGIDGSQDVPSGYNPYPYNPSKAKSMLSAAGFSTSNPLQIKFLYRSDSQGSTALFNNVSSQLNGLGVVKVTGVPTNQSDFYGKYLFVPNTKSAPSPAYKGTWDMASAGWGPDWFGNAALTYFNPLYSSPGGFPANGGSNFGYFSSSTVNNLINQALSQPTEAAADKIWAQADEEVMKEAAFYPITSVLAPAEHAPYVHNAVYMTQWQNFDPANVWLSKPGSS
ncbi:MAG TPA: ABC transporter substrate-binding protein [Streptosporangiaceae bacterium]|nr:ABC transporter substrate-binding protein [Streptosporangiaceae bacterium]